MLEVKKNLITPLPPTITAQNITKLLP